MENTVLKKCKKCKKEYPATAEYFFRHKIMKGGFELSCKQCMGHRFGVFTELRPIIDGMVVCPKCKRTLPADHHHFYRQRTNIKKHRPIGLAPVCKECLNVKFSQEKNIPTDHKQCSKCKKILPKNSVYFYKDHSRKDGFLCNCRVCSGRKQYADVDVTTGNKRCCNCKKILPATLEYFYKSRQTKEGLAGRCKKCYNEGMSEDSKIASRLRCVVRASLKQQGITKKNKTSFYIGCSVKKFKKYFISKFTEGMTWERFMNGEIHIDHIKPKILFDLTNGDQLKKCFFYKNLQPMWGVENLSKYTKYKGKTYIRRANNIICQDKTPNKPSKFEK